MSNTIYALATGSRKAAIAIIRVSGKNALSTLNCMTKRGRDRHKFHARTLYYTDLVDGVSGSLIDKAMVVYMPKPHSATGEDICELHIHGGQAIIEATLRSLASIGNTAAQAGEFTKRAYINGKLSLFGVETLASAINARSSAQLTIATRQWKEEMRVNELIEQWTNCLIDSAAAIDAYIDFSATDDIDQDTTLHLTERLEYLVCQLRERCRKSQMLAPVQDGVQIAIVGRPNAGKSSLMNCMLEQDRALVADVEGTTRDVLREQVNIGANHCILLDTAGLRLMSNDQIERMGIEKAIEAIHQSHICIVVFDATGRRQNEDWISFLRSEVKQLIPEDIKAKLMLVVNKIDLINEQPGMRQIELNGQCAPVLCVSCLTDVNIASIGYHINQLLTKDIDIDDNDIVFIQARQRELLHRIVDECQSALIILQTFLTDHNADLCLVSLHLRQAIECFYA